MEPSDALRNAQQETAKLRAELAAAHRLADRLREEAQAAERAKNEFLANIGHEIRTPMNAILGFCRMLLKDSLNPEQLEKLQYVHNAAESLLQTMSNVLNYSRLAAGDLKLTRAPFELDAVLHEVMIATQDPARHKGLAIDYLVEKAVPRRLLGDSGRLRQVLGNLVCNALKFTEQGEVHVRASLDERNGETAVIRLVVTDTGVGIAPDRQQVIFDAFAQADGSSTRRFGGLGLGLTICKQLVDLMGGEIGFRSQPGRGSSFWVTVPLQIDSRPAAPGQEPPAERNVHVGRLQAAQPPEAASSEGRRRRPRVLVADDDYLNRTLVEMLLGRAACLIDTATNGREAAEMAARAPYDLVLMDLQMPEMDGLAAIRSIRDEAGPNQATPIVALTAFSTDSDRKRCREAGADEYLAKPFTPEALLEMAARFLPGCLETGAEERREAGPQHDAPHLLRECFQAICRALGNRDFGRLETSAGRLKNASLGAGARLLADHAMRVQFAARCNDLKEAAQAVDRLHAALGNQTPRKTFIRNIPASLETDCEISNR